MLTLLLSNRISAKQDLGQTGSRAKGKSTKRVSETTRLRDWLSGRTITNGNTIPATRSGLSTDD